MLRCKAKPYTKGENKYIFMSYSHKDSAKVFPVIEKLADEGFRVWYDEGIDPGTEWPEMIASYLSKASCCIAFISQNAIESNECRREITYAIRNKINLITVFLEETKLSPGMEMQLSPYQAVFKYKIPSQEEFYEKIIGTEMLQECREKSTNADEAETSVVENAAAGDAAEIRKKPFGKKKLLILAACIVAVLAVAVGVAFGLGWIKPSLKNESVIRITLTAEEGLEAQALQEDIDTLKNRLDLFCNGKKFSMDVDGDTIHLALPKAAFGDEDAKSILRCYITRRIVLYAINLDEQSQSEEIKRSDIESVECLYGTIDGVNPKDYDIETDEYHYLKIKLSKEAAKKINSFGKRTVFARDVDCSTWYYWHTIPAPGKNEYYIISDGNAGIEEICAKLTAYNLQHNPLHAGFYYEINMDDRVFWETKKEESFGDHQCNYNDFTDKTITFVLKSSSALTENMLAEDLQELKARLDTLGEPYAFGRLHMDDGYIHVAIKTTLSQMDDSIMNILGAKGNLDDFCLLSNLTEEPVYEFREEDPCFSFESSGYGFSVKIKKDKDVLNKLANKAAASGGEKIYLMCKNCALFEAEVTQAFEDDCIEFCNFAVSGTKLSLAAEKIVALLNRVACGYLNHAYGLQSIWFNTDAHGEAASRDDFLCSNEDALEGVQRACDSAEITTNDDGYFRVKLHLPFDQNLVKHGLQIAKEIYKAVDFEANPYLGLAIYLTDEGLVNERTRIFFVKRTRDLSSDKDGDIYTHGVFANGRANTYQQEFLTAISSDPFYVNLNRDSVTKDQSDFSGWLKSPV